MNSPRKRREEKAAEQLRQLFSKYDLEKWIFTRKVLIDSSSIPHSHPVLTLNTKYIGSDDLALSTFLHEQFHWLLELEQEKTTAAMEDLRQAFPDAPTEPPLGARGESSTYLHLIVNCMEFLALKELLGIERAVRAVGSKTHYMWIYKTVLSETDRIHVVLREHKLLE